MVTPWIPERTPQTDYDLDCRRVEAGRDRIRPVQLEMARALFRLHLEKWFVKEGCATVSELGQRLGLSSRETWLLVHVGECLQQRPGIDKVMEAGEIPLESAEQLRRVFLVEDDPEHPLPGRSDIDWIEMARVTTASDLRHLVEYHLELWRTGERPIPISVMLSPKGLRAYRRAKAVARHRLGKPLTDGEALEHLSREYLERHDPILKELRTADGSMEETARHTSDPNDPTSRYVAKHVRRALLRRDGGTCAVPGCDWDGPLHRGHLVPHAAGGPTTLENQLEVCPMHNFMMEMGLLVIEGDGNDPVFPLAKGKVRVPWIYDPRDGPRFRAWVRSQGLMVGRDPEGVLPWAVEESWLLSVSDREKPRDARTEAPTAARAAPRTEAVAAEPPAPPEARREGRFDPSTISELDWFGEDVWFAESDDRGGSYADDTGGREGGGGGRDPPSEEVA